MESQLISYLKFSEGLPKISKAASRRQVAGRKVNFFSPTERGRKGSYVAIGPSLALGEMFIMCATFQRSGDIERVSTGWFRPT